MHKQTTERSQRLLESALPNGPDPEHTLETGVVAVAPGSGNKRLFQSYGAARVIEGGQTMNPSTADILAAIESTPATEVLVLPNNSNVILAAEQAVANASKPARVVPSKSVQAGLAAIVRYLPSLDADANERAMLDALASVATGEVTVASRDVELDGIAVRKGAYLGLADGSAVACGHDFEEVASAVAERLLEGEREFLTILTGDEAPELNGLLTRLQEAHPGVELDVQAGGQPHYPLLLAAE
jgi:dihydroxyacetone kinase-like predicted kinase